MPGTLPHSSSTSPTAGAPQYGSELEPYGYRKVNVQLRTAAPGGMHTILGFMFDCGVAFAEIAPTVTEQVARLSRALPTLPPERNVNSTLPRAWRATPCSRRPTSC